jgi:uncharacterized protein
VGEEIESCSSPKVRRILSIDGGGIAGTFPASFLAELEAELPSPIGQYFDLIAGTSTGGILALGLGLGLTAREVLTLYADRGPYIFGGSESGFVGSTKRFGRSIRQIFRPKHDANLLKAELEKVLKGKRLGDAQTRLVIPAWDADHRSVYIFKTAHHSRLKTDFRRTAVDAAMATSAAPHLFSAPPP